MSFVPEAPAYNPATYSLEMEKLRRKQALAQAMQGGQLQQGQMVGDRYVAPSPLGQLAAVGQQLAGAYLTRKLNDQSDALQQGRQKQVAEILRGLVGGNGSGSPGSAVPTTAPAAPPQDGVGPTRLPQNPTAAALRGQPPDPSLQFIQSLPLDQQEQLAGQIATSRLFPSQKEGFTLGAGQKRYDASGKLIAEGPVDTKSLFGNVSPSDFTPESVGQFQKTGDYSVLVPKNGGQKLGNVNPGDFTPVSLAQFLKTGNYSDLVRYVTPANPSVQIVGGVPTVVQPSRTGGAPTQAPLSNLPAEAGAKSDLAAAEARGKAEGAAQAEAAASLQANLDDIDKMKTDVAGLLNAPGFGTIYGLSGKLDPRNYIAGTDAADAEARRNQLEAQSFGISIQKMRGLGQLSENEGKKVTAAYTRAIDKKQSSDAARAAWNEVLGYLDTARERAKQKAGTASGSQVPDDIAALLKKHGQK